MTIDVSEHNPKFKTTVPKDLYLPSHVIKIVEVAKKYAGPEGTPIIAVPEYTEPGGPNSYRCTDNAHAWTQGFLPGSLWLLVEHNRLLPGSLAPYTEEEVIRLAQRYQQSFENMKRPAENHDQGFRFQLSYGRAFNLLGIDHDKEVLIEAAESLLDRYSETAGAIRSWDQFLRRDDLETYASTRTDQHWLVIIDTMMNLDILYEATRLTGDIRYERAATRQAESCSVTHVRPDYTTCHVVDIDQRTGDLKQRMTAQGYSNDSCWSRGQGWAIYGYAQCALRTGRQDFTVLSRKLADVFLSLLEPNGVPAWDFMAPKPCPYDASAGFVAARGMQMLYKLLKDQDHEAAKFYLNAANKLATDVLRECLTSEASIVNGQVKWGKGDWETILEHSTIAGYEFATRCYLDHGLVYADYYMLEFAIEAIKLARGGA